MYNSFRNIYTHYVHGFYSFLNVLSENKIHVYVALEIT